MLIVVQSALNSTKNNKISRLVDKLDKSMLHLVYIIIVMQGLLESRQNVAWQGLAKPFPWTNSSIQQCLAALIRFDVKETNELAAYLLNVSI